MLEFFSLISSVVCWFHCPAAANGPPMALQWPSNGPPMRNTQWMFFLLLKATILLAVCTDLISLYSLSSKINTDNISIALVFFLSFFIFAMKLLDSKSNLASLAEGLCECYQPFLCNASSCSSLTSWHRAKQRHMKHTSRNKAQGKGATASRVCTPLGAPVCKAGLLNTAP